MSVFDLKIYAVFQYDTDVFPKCRWMKVSIDHSICTRPLKLSANKKKQTYPFPFPCKLFVLSSLLSLCDLGSNTTCLYSFCRETADAVWRVIQPLFKHDDVCSSTLFSILYLLSLGKYFFLNRMKYTVFSLRLFAVSLTNHLHWSC